MKQKKNVVGLIGFILSIVAIFTLGLTSFVGLILSIIGVAIAKDYDNDKKGLSIAGIVISSIMLLVFIVLLLSPSSISSDNTSTNIKTTEETSNETSTQKEVELSEKDKLESKIVTLMKEKLAFDAGDYIQGDIPVGEYAFIKFEGSGSYYCEKDASGSIVDNENFDSFGYVYVHGVGNLTTRGILINVSTFERLGVSGAKQIYEMLNNKESWNQSGYYKVGVDIDPGSYVLESIGSGYYAIMTGPVSNSEIVDNDNFNGRASVNISTGQYLKLSRVIISQ